MNGSIYYKMQGHFTESRNRMCTQGHMGLKAESYQESAALFLLCHSAIMYLWFAWPDLSLSPALSLPPQAGSLRNNEVQVGWPTAAALEPCSQDIHLHMTLFQVSKPQFPSKKWPSLFVCFYASTRLFWLAKYNQRNWNWEQADSEQKGEG